MIQRALFSVTDKTGLEELVKALTELYPHIELLASGGTAKYLRSCGFSVVNIEEYTGAPHCFGGRVKTLHPKIAGGILYRRGEDDKEAETLDILPIDLVACNLYAFEQKPCIDEIDIGGSTLIRSAAKNHESVAVLVSPTQYAGFVEALRKGCLDREWKRRLAVEAFNLSADYDAAISTELSKQYLGSLQKRTKLLEGKALRYGENPDQEGWIYHFEDTQGLAQGTLLNGKEMSYNNYEDATCAYEAVSELGCFGKPACAIIKHGGLCGLATADTIQEAFNRAWEGDSKSAFGGIIALSREADDSLISALKGKFFELIIAPEFSIKLLSWIKEKKPDVRVIKVPESKDKNLCYKTISGGMLVQSKKPPLQRNPLQVVSKTAVEEKKKDLIYFSIAAVKHAKSNAVVITREISPACFQLIGVGAGQANRIDSLQRLAIPKAQENLRLMEDSLDSCVLATDGFFPFADSVKEAASYGIKLCVQPGGSKRDNEVIEAADESGMCMIFTGERYFSH